MDSEVSIEALAVPYFNEKPRSLTPRENAAFQQWFTEALAKNWIEKSTSRHSSGLLFVPKKNGELRTVVNFVRLNEITKSRVYAPLANTTLRQAIARSRYYTKIDLKNAFYHMTVRQKDRWLTAFRTPRGLYQFRALPQGLKNAPGEFQLYIESILAELIGDEVTVHIDDILIHCLLRERCAALSKQVVRRLHDARIEINKEKSQYLVSTVDYCSYRYGNGVITPLCRTETVDDWPTPRNKTEVQAILGFANHFRDHAPSLASIATPLYALTGKADWAWTSSHQKAFELIKKTLHRLVSTHEHMRDQPAEITTDASLFGIGCILHQGRNVTAIISRSLTKEERNYDAAERELLAVVYALDKWIWLVEDSPRITVHTDNMINTGLLTPSSSNRRRNRWIERLSRHVITWHHIPGKNNSADYPSRRDD